MAERLHHMKVMPRLLRKSALLAGVLVAGLAGPAAAGETEQAETLRQSRPGFLAFSPVWPRVANHDSTVPLPGLRLSVNVSPRVAFDLTGGFFPQTGGSFNLIDVGARWFFAKGNFAPYLMGRAGKYSGYNDEGPDPSYLYVTLGPGIEYASDGGFVAWIEYGPALLGGNRGWYGSFGLGYRFGSPPPQPPYTPKKDD